MYIAVAVAVAVAVLVAAAVAGEKIHANKCVNEIQNI
jgi:hypothetical protein